LLALGTEGGVVVVWDVAKGAIACELGAKGTGHTSRVRSVAFSSALRLVSVGDDRQCFVWDVGTGSVSPLSRFECQTAGPALVVVAGLVKLSHVCFFFLFLLCIFLGSEGSVFVGGSQLCEWDSLSGRPLKQLSGGHAAPVNLLAFSGEEFSLASGAGDRFVCVWRKSGTKEVLAATQPLSKLYGSLLGVAAISEDGSKVFFWQDGEEVEVSKSSSKSAKKSKTGSAVTSTKAREPFATLLGNNHPVLDIQWDRETALVARLVGGRPQFFRVVPGESMPSIDSMPGAANLEVIKNTSVAIDGLSAFDAPLRVSQPNASIGLNAGGAGTVVGIIRQALLTRDNVLLGEAINSPVKPEGWIC
jgi:WD40 repeat protein